LKSIKVADSIRLSTQFAVLSFITTPPVNGSFLVRAEVVWFQLVSSPHHRSTYQKMAKTSSSSFNWFHHHTTGQQQKGMSVSYNSSVSIGFITTPPVNPKPYFFSLFFSKLQAIFPVLKKWLKDSCFGMKYAENLFQ